MTTSNPAARRNVVRDIVDSVSQPLFSVALWLAAHVLAVAALPLIVVVIPIGLIVLLGTWFAGGLLAILVSAVSADLAGLIMMATFVLGLVAAFKVYVGLYRALPAKLRKVWEEPEEPSVDMPAVPRENRVAFENRIRDLDANLATRTEGSSPGVADRGGDGRGAATAS